MDEEEKAPKPKLQPKPSKGAKARDPFIRPANEDDDGYDPWSDRRPEPEPLWEEDPWA